MNTTKIYFYNGFDVPELIDIKTIELASNYLGDITDDFVEEFNYFVTSWTMDDMKENQPLSQNYFIWIDPKKEQLSEFNKSVMLPENAYLEEF